jgi:hypothetical protein
MSVACAIAVVGCSSDHLLSPDVVSFTAKTIVNPNPSYYRIPVPTIETTVTMTNVSDRVYSIKTDECGLSYVKVFSQADRSGPPVWQPTGPVECAAVGVFPSPLNPGESRELVLTARVSDVLGDTLPSGTYYIDAVVGFFSNEIERKSLQVEVDGGAVQLTR